MSKSKILILSIVAVALSLFFYFDGTSYLQLETLKAQQAQLNSTIAENPLTSAATFFTVYVVATAFSVPGALVLTLAGGALFGLVQGLVIISFASTIGATIAFLGSRYLFRDTLRARYAKTLARIDEGIKKDGAFYLASLRLVPVFPFFMINLVMGLTSLPMWRYYWVSQLTMLPGTFVYVFAGTELGQIASLGDVFTFDLFLAFTLLGVFPLIAKSVLGMIERKRLYRGYEKPQSFDYNLLVIGAGAGGLVSSYIGAAVKARVGLIEKHKMGGDCLNTGCVPSKALIRSAKVAQTIREADKYGLEAGAPSFSFAKVMERVQDVVRKVEPHDSIERYTKLGVEVIEGSARLLSPWEVEVTYADGRQAVLTAKSLIIASGGRPFVPPIEGIEQVEPLTSDTIWSIRNLPKRLVVLGGGPIGSELTQSFARLGASVTQIERGDRLLPREDVEVSEHILQAFRKDGVDVRLLHNAVKFAIEDGEKVLYCEHQGATVRIAFDAVLVAVGRAANTANLGLENLGIEPLVNGTLPTRDDLSVRFPNVFACGDVAGPYQFTHTAAHQAWYAAVNGLFGSFKRFKADYSVIPWVTFTAPEVARVGLSEAEAQAQGIAYEVVRYGLDDLDRAIAESEDEGFIKVLTPPGKDKILGVVVVGAHGGEILSEFILAMRHGLGLNKILGTIHPYPTWNESVKYAAGQWKQAHAPQTVLKWLERFHQRGLKKTSGAHVESRVASQSSAK